MATVGVTPIQMKDATLTVAGDDYAAAVSSVSFIPSPTWLPAFGGGSLLAYVTWSCRVGLLQDLASGSLVRYLLAHAGEAATVVFTPRLGGPAITASLTLAPAGIGGSATEMLAADVDLPVIGSPAVA